jgi:hypothetical protein
MSEYCAYCDTKILPDRVTCSQCGAPVTKKTKERPDPLSETIEIDMKTFCSSQPIKTFTFQYDEI